MAEENKFKSIEDIIGETQKREYTDYKNYMQNAFEDSRVELFRKHYINSMDEDKKKEFEKMNEAQKRLAVSKTDYKLTGDHAEAFVRDLALSAMYQIDEGKKNWYKDAKGKDGGKFKVEEHAKNMKKFMDVLEDKNASDADREHAEGEIDHYIAMVKKYIPKWEEMVETGKQQGFTKELIQKNAGYFGKNFYDARQMGRLKTKIGEDDVNQYIKEEIAKHPEFKDFDTQLATHPNVDKGAKIGMAHTYLSYKKELAPDALKDFKETYSQYFPAKKEG